MEINIKLKELREKNGYTQRNIADYLGVDQSFVSKVEKGERSFTSDMIERLASLFGIHVSALLSEKNEDIPSTACAFRASDLSAEDLNTIAFINRIAINANYMTELLENNNDRKI